MYVRKGMIVIVRLAVSIGVCVNLNQMHSKEQR